MPKSRNTRAKKVQSERNRFSRLFAFCCCRMKPYPSADDVENEKDVYKPSVTDFTEDLVNEDHAVKRTSSSKRRHAPPPPPSPKLAEKDGSDKLDDIGDKKNELNAVPIQGQTLELPNIKLDPHLGEDITRQRPDLEINAIEEYPEDLNPFSDDESDQIACDVEEIGGDIYHIGGGDDQMGASVDKNGDDVDMNDERDHESTQGDKTKRNSIDDYPEELNPFAEEE